ncbi:elongation factor P--(R)-beta-lysine ligase [Aliiglaciecola sp. CAU 1673]|uniref:elongation factor P--(R)-beta-lysine ligase n=1 Tax=Aliiglaciecola sp. CAU 1673 TaxID=3032595 RepID=UPI0023DB7FF8|nr:elongation factor P--(R)-beta-lysine ligase [Aliiglaciecola sp. CAU 1673]MDF2177913.1 elongation factor P--(R)-beta-lysine ligase [Aliiglaciecola sp. CAU 1673]
MNSLNWQPTASIDNLRRRAQLLADIRRFFAERNVMEVETPALSQATVTDEHLHCFSTEFIGPGAANGKILYLQTSPEYAMKRLLAAGSGAIYQLAKAYRNEEAGRFHNPEFTMLEWYRPGFDHFALMQELDELVQQLLHCGPATQITYQQAFIQHLGLDPLIADLSMLRNAAIQLGHGELAANENDCDTLLQLLFCDGVEPHIGAEAPCFVYDFPASQASLAKLNPEDPRVAQRFELYFKQLELANGFHELDDPTEQKARFERDNQKRIAAGRPPRPIDPYLLAALEAGLPPCAGVAVGVDRLMMLAMDAEQIKDVLSFSVDNA